MLFIFFIKGTNAQDIVKITAVVQYKFTDNSKQNSIPDTMNLEIGEKGICKFYSYHNYIVDSMRRNTSYDNWHKYKTTGNRYKLYINFPERKITVNNYAFASFDNYEYEEDLIYPEWNVSHTDTKKILHFDCKKATCRYKGRDYIAWYASWGLPINRGPYKFGGLPGLILEIVDTDNLFLFECIGFGNFKEGYIVKDKGEQPVKKISRQDFINMQKRSHENPKAALTAMYKEVGRIDTDDFMKQIPDDKKIPYNPIELE
jgi:GLPGLI family protein